MQIAKLIKKPIGNAKIDYYITIDGETTTQVIKDALLGMKSTFPAYIPSEEDLEKFFRDTVGDQQFEFMLRDYVMGLVSPYVINDESDLNLALEPQCESDKFPHRDESFEFTMHVLLKPKYELTSYEPVEVTVPVYKVPESAVDKQIDELAEMNIFYKRVEDNGEPAELGQHVLIDMETTKGGENMPGLTGEGRLLELDYNYMPKDFVDNIVGMKVGETKSFDFEGPREGATSIDDTETFSTTITLREFQNPTKPKITDAWIEVNLPDAGSLEGLRNQIRESLEAQAKTQSQQDLSALIDMQLAERFEGSISDDIYKAASQSIYRSMSAELQQQGKTLEDMMREHGMSREHLNMQVMLQARDIIRQGFALDKYFEVMVGELNDEDIEEAYRSFAPGNEDAVRAQFEGTGRLYAVREVARRLKAHKHLAERAIIHYQDIEVPAPHAHDEQEVDN
ncbi:MAG: trigger factor [Coriobacteriales bacterium]|jgi:trigger factor